MRSHFFIYTRVESSKSSTLGTILAIKRYVRKTRPRNRPDRSSPRCKQEHTIQLGVSKAHTNCGRKLAPSCCEVHIVSLQYLTPIHLFVAERAHGASAAKATSTQVEAKTTTPSISPGDALAVSRGVEPSTSAGVASDAPYHEAASTRSNPNVEETIDSTHAKGASGVNPPATCVDFAHTDRDPLQD